MLQPLAIPGGFFRSLWEPERRLFSNSYFFVTPNGNAAVDPLPADETEREEMRRLGGVRAVVLTTPERSPAGEALAKEFDAQLVSAPDDGAQIFDGASALRLRQQPASGEFAIHFEEHHAVLVGTSIIGTPAGALSWAAREETEDVKSAALGLRRLLGLSPEILLVGHGTSLFRSADEALLALLRSHAGVELHRINVDELDFTPFGNGNLDAEVGLLLGAKKLGYRVSILQPGQRFCPLHSHASEEELFFVLDGEPSVRMSAGTLKCRRGDFIAFPTGDIGAHQLLNESSAPATVLLLARTEVTETCYYPDSDKVMVDTEKPLIRGLRSLIVRASPALDYLDGE